VRHSQERRQPVQQRHRQRRADDDQTDKVDHIFHWVLSHALAAIMS
jgi:hypothetical protein